MKAKPMVEVESQASECLTKRQKMNKRKKDGIEKTKGKGEIGKHERDKEVEREREQEREG